MGGELTLCTVVVTVVAFAITMGIFWGLNYPQIIINKYYVETTCTIDGSTSTSNYCPNVQCSTCSQLSLYAPSCSSIVSYTESLNPATCNNTNNPFDIPTQPESQCGVSQACDGGYKCCAQCCSTCCSTSCTGSGSSKSCSTVCVQCNCYCCSSVDNLSCYMYADICFTGILYLHYNDRTGHRVNTSYSQYFGTNTNNLENFLSQQYQIDHSYTCFYDTRDETNILFNIGYTSGYWVAFGIFAFILLIGIVALIDAALTYSLCDVEAINMRKLEFLIWMTFIFPLCLWLPLQMLNTISYLGHVVFLVLLCQFVTIGPIPLLWSLGKNYVLVIYSIIYICVGWLVPFHQAISDNDVVFIPSMILIPIFVFIISLWMIANFSFISKFCTYEWKSCSNWCLNCLLPKPPNYVPPSPDTNVTPPPPQYSSSTSSEYTTTSLSPYTLPVLPPYMSTSTLPVSSPYTSMSIVYTPSNSIPIPMSYTPSNPTPNQFLSPSMADMNSSNYGTHTTLYQPPPPHPNYDQSENRFDVYKDESRFDTYKGEISTSKPSAPDPDEDNN